MSMRPQSQARPHAPGAHPPGPHARNDRRQARAGHRNRLGRRNEVVEMVPAAPDRFGELFGGDRSEDGARLLAVAAGLFDDRETLTARSSEGRSPT